MIIDRRLFILVDNPGLVGSGCDINEAHEQRNLVILVQIVPDILCEALDIPVNSDQRRFTLVAGQRIAVSHIGVNEMSLASLRILVSVSESLAGIRIAIVAL